MITERKLLHQVLNEISFRHNISSFMDFLKSEIIESDIHKKYFKFSTKRATIVSFKQGELDEILAKIFKCTIDELTIVIDNKIGFGEWIEDSEYLLNECANSEHPGIKTAKLKYEFLKSCDTAISVNEYATPGNFGDLIKVGFHIFNGFESLYGQLISDKKKTEKDAFSRENSDVLKKYKVGILLIGAVCQYCRREPVGSPIDILKLKIYYEKFKNGEYGKARKLTAKGVEKGTITETDCTSARMIFLKCGLKYGFKTRDGILDIVVMN